MFRRMRGVEVSFCIVSLVKSRYMLSRNFQLIQCSIIVQLISNGFKTIQTSLMCKDFSFNYLLPIILASLRFLLLRNCKLIIGSVLKICCSSTVQHIIQGPNIQINHGFLIKIILDKSYEQNKRRNVFSLLAHNFNFSIYSFDVLSSDTTCVKILS